MKKQIYMLLTLLILILILCLIFFTYVFVFSGNKENLKEENENRVSLQEYEVCSINQYRYVETNLFGAIKQQKIYYVFGFISDGAGTIKMVYDFYPSRYGKDTILIGEKNKFVYNNISHERILYLTKETLSSITLLEEGR